MVAFRKAVLQVGKPYKSPDGDVVVTSDRLKHWQKQFRRLQANGYDVPIDWDHAADINSATPVAMSERERRRSAKNTVGQMADFKLSPDGNSAEITLEVSDPRGVEQAESNRVYVSPVIMPSWRDGHGNDYADVITHVDFVNHPVDHSQGPFEKCDAGAIACGIRMGLSPVYRMAADMADEKEQEDDVVDPTDIEKPEDDKPEVPEVPSADDARVKKVIALLGQSSLKIALPEDTSAENFWERFESALMTANAQQASMEPSLGPDGADVTTAQPGIATMSADSPVAKYANEVHRKQIAERLQKLLDTGRCLPKELHERQPQAKAVALSLDASGKSQPCDLEKWIVSREAVPEGAFWDAKERTTRLSADTPKPRIQTNPEAGDVDAAVRAAARASGR